MSSNGNIFRVTDPLWRGIQQSPVDSPHKGRWRRALMFSLICAWKNGWAHNRDAGDTRPHWAHYDATVMENANIFMYSKVISSSHRSFMVQHLFEGSSIPKSFMINQLYWLQAESSLAKVITYSFNYSSHPNMTYHEISNIRCTKSLNLNVPGLGMQLSLRNIF